MATSVQTSISEYLNTSYRPDRGYIDGEILERRIGKWEHSRVQALLTIWFGQHEQSWDVQTATEWRTQVSALRVRIPGRSPCATRISAGRTGFASSPRGRNSLSG